jgi:hypothetical protein
LGCVQLSRIDTPNKIQKAAFKRTIMKKIKIAVLCFSFFGMSVAYADILATGPVFFGASQKSVVCYLFNAGVGAVNITNKSIYRYDSPTSTAPLTPLDEDTCPASLNSGASCHIRKFIVNNRAHACRVVISPSGNDVRGRFEIRDSGDFVLQGSDLR